VLVDFIKAKKNEGVDDNITLALWLDSFVCFIRAYASWTYLQSLVENGHSGEEVLPKRLKVIDSNTFYLCCLTSIVLWSNNVKKLV
jgi:hypothetical protein